MNAETPSSDFGASWEWRSRGYLPHRDRPGLLQTVTFRLADSLPQDKLRALEHELSRLRLAQRAAERRKKIEQWLDAGMGCCVLRHPAVANEMRRTLLHFHGTHYQLLAWCIMPNHVHALVETAEPMAKVVQSWKSVSARWILARNEKLMLGAPHPRHVWMREYWDRFIRSEKHFYTAVDYIHRNPVMAGLCTSAEEWPWSSAGDSNQADEGVGAPG